MTKQIILNAFEMTSAMHKSHGLWKHADSKRHRRYKGLDYWIKLAKLLENRGCTIASFLEFCRFSCSEWQFCNFSRL